ncbi:type 2 phosphatidylinositol 4,5-bisphosphate 4-phosphatase-like isoform X2 [Centruroides sculpturatus]|uniref:type 2 phosphatidylinositol 4,5-bisphosphate 4-phosphatase-like isoform X1 n=1 Tax=Centruroides sculpturatus TaxID=218467 RepID=UPI000C6E0F12|nr:type 2 phosphatidylinositol 4,5-bisphosphate 4-phosphatase-like isoform X1 [Centruroides sculpturatus]XP_023230849.1 type 2 phosphatidylinositol 4,5-bisphosphate 4-phosphatase-like isoform X2 [Centruroides sculpturatus]
MARVSCGHCENMFLFNTLNNALARCPHCRKLSTVGVNFARCRVLIYVALSLICLVVAIVVTVTTKYGGKYAGAWIALYAACYVAFAVFLGRAVYYYTIRVSTVLSYG